MSRADFRVSERVGSRSRRLSRLQAAICGMAAEMRGVRFAWLRKRFSAVLAVQ